MLGLYTAQLSTNESVGGLTLKDELFPKSICPKVGDEIKLWDSKERPGAWSSITVTIAVQVAVNPMASVTVSVISFCPKSAQVNSV